MGLRAFVQDHPPVVTVTIWVGVGVHAWAAKRWGFIPDLNKFARSEDAVSVYGQFSGAAAMIAGFSGVVVVFAMTPGLKRFARMRVTGRDRLEANWLSPTVNAFAGAFLAVGAAVAAAAGHARSGLFLFELAALLTMHGSLRLCWSLRRLMVAMRRSDEDRARPAPVDIEDVASKS